MFYYADDFYYSRCYIPKHKQLTTEKNALKLHGYNCLKPSVLELRILNKNTQLELGRMSLTYLKHFSKFLKYLLTYKIMRGRK